MNAYQYCHLASRCRLAGSIRRVVANGWRSAFIAQAVFVFLFLGSAVWELTAQDAIGFNKDILPILSDKCFACHGPDKNSRKTTLRFDREDGPFTPLSEGRFAIVRGKPEQSEMFRRITSQDDAVRMPPAYAGREPLNNREIDLIARWIRQGAKWEKHWAFIPPRTLELPRVANVAWPRNQIDQFVLARLERESLSPSPEADRLTLIRRVSFDLTGLPPTLEQIEQFLRDSSPGAYEKMLDRFLASPRYGERMAIRWLDAARYADTNGYSNDGVRTMWRWRDWVIDAFNRNMPFDRFTIEQIAGDLLPNASRDQVIASGFHRNHRTSGEGGIVPEEFRVEYVADRVQTTGTVWLGLTVGCARCHDHKYDPISQKEFYQLFAYFNNVPEKGQVYNYGNEEPMVEAPTPQQAETFRKLDQKVESAREEWHQLEPEVAKQQRIWEQSLLRQPDLDWSLQHGLVLHYPLDGVLATGCHDGRPVGAGSSDCQVSIVAGKINNGVRFNGERFIDAGNVGRFNYLDAFSLAAWIYPESPTGAIVSRIQDFPQGEGYGLYLKDGRIRLHITIRWTDIGLRIETENAVQLKRWQHILMTYDGKRKASGVNIYLDGHPLKLKVLFDELNSKIATDSPFRIGAGEGPENRFHGIIDEVRAYNFALSRQQAAALPVLESLGKIAALAPEQRSTGQTHKLNLAFLDRFAPRTLREKHCELLDALREREDFLSSIPTVMVMKENPQVHETFVLQRGAYDRPGERVFPSVPAIFTQLRPDWPNNRLGLARWLVDASNPLTARVTVNRFWEMLFGTGLVKTVEDFGFQGERASHPELLDWLASEFVRQGWDVKKILKTILTSATYRQASRVSSSLLEKDPDNRLLARGPRFRLPAEMLRDQALAISGLLVEKIGGPPVKPYQPPGLWEELSMGQTYEPDHGEALYRRSLYTYWKRTIAPPAMITFDASDRENCSVRITRTNTPLQALNLMNDVTYLEASRHFAERLMKTGGTAPEDRIRYAFRLATARTPRSDETAAVLRAFETFRKDFEKDPDGVEKFLAQGESARDLSLPQVELAAYAATANLILNLDEAITKE